MQCCTGKAFLGQTKGASPAQTAERPSISEPAAPTPPCSLLYPRGILGKYSHHLSWNLVKSSEDQISVVLHSSQAAKVNPQEKGRVHLKLLTREINHLPFLGFYPALVSEVRTWALNF